MPDIVYVLTNPAMPGFVKIGYTTQEDVQARMKQLHTTGVPEPFECAIAVQVKKGQAKALEKALHTAFAPDQGNASREFFKMDLERVLAILRMWPGRDVTPKGNKKVKKRGMPRPPLSGEKEAYRVFSRGLIDRLREKYNFTGATNERGQRWCYFVSGFSGVLYGASFYSREKKAKVELYLNGDKDRNEILYDKLIENQEAIESELQEPLEWRRLDKSCLIAVTRAGSITDSPEVLEEIQDWMIERLLKFKQIFGPRLKDLIRES